MAPVTVTVTVTVTVQVVTGSPRNLQQIGLAMDNSMAQSNYCK